MHGGSVSAHSDGRDRGSEFVVRLPIHEGAAAGAQALRHSSAPAAEDREARRRVLVVDDNEDAAELVAHALREIGHAVAVAHDGVGALALAEEFGPTVGVLDIGLPVMDGYELARRLRERPDGRTLALVAVTGYGQPADREQAIAAGFDEHLVKPVALPRLFAAIEEAASRERPEDTASRERPGDTASGEPPEDAASDGAA
jgi:CheY-like chemotaxis protein